MRPSVVVVSLFCAVIIGGCGSPQADEKMSFFVTSIPAGEGGAIGGLAGADRQCQALAKAAGSTKRIWRAYLSVTAEPGESAVHARDRIGAGPWFNVHGVQIAANLDELHIANTLGDATSLDERGQSPGYWHDVMTGSNPDGTVATGDMTCHNWTSTSGHAMVGHSNKAGHDGGARATSWNSAHASGCTLAALQANGGNGRLYCFAADSGSGAR